MASEAIRDFVRESNRIEGITREPTNDEVEATRLFSTFRTPSIRDVCNLVEVYAPGHRLRDAVGLNVRVGNHIAPAGGPDIRDKLNDLLNRAARADADPWAIHVEYETLHPFTDGNGRSGRAIWLNMMIRSGQYHPFLLFLHHFYYQTLSGVRMQPRDPAATTPEPTPDA